jgi:hypothetical protein
VWSIASPGDRAVYGVVLGRLVTGIAGSNPARIMDVCLCLCVYVVLSCVGRGLCDELVQMSTDTCYVITEALESMARSGLMRQTGKKKTGALK